VLVKGRKPNKGAIDEVTEEHPSSKVRKIGARPGGKKREDAVGGCHY